MIDKAREALMLRFDRRLRLEFHGARTASDAGLLACRELDRVSGSTEAALNHIRDTRAGRNRQHQVVPLLSQSVYRFLASSEDTNDLESLARD